MNKFEEYRDIYKECLLSGVDLCVNRLTLANLKNVRRFPFKYKYQVHLEGKVSELFYDENEAVQRFIELRK